LICIIAAKFSVEVKLKRPGETPAFFGLNYLANLSVLLSGNLGEMCDDQSPKF
jgi:hypothetical protein